MRPKANLSPNGHTASRARGHAEMGALFHSVQETVQTAHTSSPKPLRLQVCLHPTTRPFFPRTRNEVILQDAFGLSRGRSRVQASCLCPAQFPEGNHVSVVTRAVASGRAKHLNSSPGNCSRGNNSLLPGPCPEPGNV